MTAREVAFDVVRQSSSRTHGPIGPSAPRPIPPVSTCEIARRDSSPTGLSSTPARSITPSKRSAAGPSASSTPCPRCPSPRCLPARLHGLGAEHAAVNESVELVRRAGLERAVAFTNAVMRRLVAGPPALLVALPESTPDEAALKPPYPDWWPRHGGASSAPTRAARSCAPRTSRRSAACASIAASRQPRRLPRWSRSRSPRGTYRGAHPRRLAGARPRLAAEPRVAARGASRSGRRTASAALDLCAAPGGKATQLLGDVVAVERHEGRARELTETLRLGAENVRVVCANGLALPPDLDGFDQALVDAPCSGLGTLASRPDLRWRAEPLPEPSWRCCERPRSACGPGARSRTPSAR